jgi:hypothetical protein
MIFYNNKKKENKFHEDQQTNKQINFSRENEYVVPQDIKINSSFFFFREIPIDIEHHHGQQLDLNILNAIN